MILVSVALPLFAQSGNWTTLAPTLIARQEVAVVAAGENIYLLGGITANSVTATVEVYDTRAGTWRFAAPLPEPLHHMMAATIEPFIYVFGGYRSLRFDATDTAYRYDTRSDSWEQLPSMPQRRAAGAAAAIRNEIFIVGGAGINSAVAFDGETHTYRTIAPMPTPREHLGAAAAGGKLYAISGRVPGRNLAAVEEYDPITNVWRARSPIPTPRSGIAAVETGGRIFVFGGEGNPRSETGTFAQVESFDVDRNFWSAHSPMPAPRHGIGAAAVRGTIFIPAGGPVQGFGVTTIHDAFRPAPMRRRAVRRVAASFAPSPAADLDTNPMRGQNRKLQHENSPAPARSGDRTPAFCSNVLRLLRGR